jgi:hypothetical protein
MFCYFLYCSDTYTNIIIEVQSPDTSERLFISVLERKVTVTQDYPYKTITKIVLDLGPIKKERACLLG